MTTLRRAKSEKPMAVLARGHTRPDLKTREEAELAFRELSLKSVSSRCGHCLFRNACVRARVSLTVDEWGVTGIKNKHRCRALQST